MLLDSTPHLLEHSNVGHILLELVSYFVNFVLAHSDANLYCRVAQHAALRASARLQGVFITSNCKSSSAPWLDDIWDTNLAWQRLRTLVLHRMVLIVRCEAYV